MNDIKNEFGGSSTNVALSNYYGKAGVTSSGQIKISDFYGKSDFIDPGSIAWQWSTDSEMPWNVPSNVNEIHILCIGGGGQGGHCLWGGGGGGGGGLTWINKIPVIPGELLKIRCGKGGGPGSFGPGPTDGLNGTQSYVKNSAGIIICQANGGFGGKAQSSEYGRSMGGAGATQWTSNPYGTRGGSYGYEGGSGYNDFAGGGAGGPGYGITGLIVAGWGGSKHPEENRVGQNGKCGGGGGGSYSRVNIGSNNTTYGASGGGTGILGQGSDGAGGTGWGDNGRGGSGGGNGAHTGGGSYGSGGGGSSLDFDQGNGRGAAGGRGAIRIMWGTNQSFPSNVV